MKILACLLSLCLVSVAFAQNDPAELVKLRKTWENSVAGVQARADTLYREEMNKANKLYHEELKQMKDNFMAAKNLQGAIAVDAEIKKLITEHGKQKFVASKKVQVAEKKASPLDGAWVVTCGGRKYLKLFHGAVLVDINGSRYKCTFEGKEVTVHYNRGHWDKIKINPGNPDLMDGVNRNGHKVTFERLKW